MTPFYPASIPQRRRAHPGKKRGRKGGRTNSGRRRTAGNAPQTGLEGASAAWPGRSLRPTRLEEALGAPGEVLQDPAALIRLEDLGDNALMLTVDFRVDVSGPMDLRVLASKLRHGIERAFREAGIAIACPQRDAHLDHKRPLEVVVSSAAADTSPAKKTGIPAICLASTSLGCVECPDACLWTAL